LPTSIIAIAIAHVIDITITIDLVAVACLPPSLPGLLLPLQLPSLLHSTLVAIAIALPPLPSSLLGGELSFWPTFFNIFYFYDCNLLMYW
jgi:hypothetical protein